MKRWILALSLIVLSASLLPSVAEARRFGGGGLSGMQRSVPRSVPNAAPGAPTQAAAPTAPAATPGMPGAAAPRRSWMGPIAGLAAGLGLAALLSHFGLGEGLANIVMLALLAFAGFALLRFVMRRFAPAAAQRSATPYGMAYNAAGDTPAAAAGGSSPFLPAATPLAGAAAASVANLAAPNLPAGFDSAAFERVAKMIFIRMQAANDSADLTDLRSFTTPEMFASVRVDLQERGGVAQQTDVLKIDAQVLDFVQEADRQIVSVRFHGLIREEMNGTAGPFDEVWHLVKPLDGSREWAIAGIQQSEAALH